MSQPHSQGLPAVPPRLALPGTVQVVALAAVLLGASALAWAFNNGDATLAWSCT